MKFARNNSFQLHLRKRVDDFCRARGLRQRDCLPMYVKSVILLSFLAASYGLLVFAAQNWWQALLLAISLGLAMAGVGFNIQHDASHQAYSRHRWINRMMATTLDLIGGSSYLWHWKHGVFHHTYVNITGLDTDIDIGGVGRLSPHQAWHWRHRWQHLYLWILYGLIAIKWQLFDDFYDVIRGRIGMHRVPRPRGWNLAVFLGGKAFFLTLAFGIPLALHPIGAVAIYYIVAGLVLGTVLSIVFQLAHTVEQSEFPSPLPDGDRMENAWAVHQAENSVDFARRSAVVAWLFGGLNFQIEHHLFPRICHVNYPSIAPIVKEVCREFGVRYLEHKSFRAGLASHYRWLRRMGRPTPKAGWAEPGL